MRETVRDIPVRTGCEEAPYELQATNRWWRRKLQSKSASENASAWFGHVFSPAFPRKLRVTGSSSKMKQASVTNMALNPSFQALLVARFLAATTNGSSSGLAAGGNRTGGKKGGASGQLRTKRSTAQHAGKAAHCLWAPKVPDSLFSGSSWSV